MRIPIYQIDAFTNEQFKGNPAAVCPLENWLDKEIMQKIAGENNLSETAFFVKKGQDYELKWFTPETEVDLCGHATLAAAFVIFTYLEPALSEIRFHTKSGVLFVKKEDTMLSLVFPSREGIRCEPPLELIEGLGRQPLEVYASRDYLVVFETEEDILNLKLDFEKLKQLDKFGIIVTACGNEVDFVSRFFAPNEGINEDPVTGSAHCTLIPYWSHQLKKEILTAKQVSSRGGTLYCENLGDKVKISGEAVIYMEGYITI